jgi:hypothetical protein
VEMEMRPYTIILIYSNNCGIGVASKRYSFVVYLRICRAIMK